MQFAKILKQLGKIWTFSTHQYIPGILYTSAIYHGEIHANPYLIWLSEIILQQTRIDQGMDYYSRFAAEFPTISDLADAPEDQILKLLARSGLLFQSKKPSFYCKIYSAKLQWHFP